MAVSTSAKAAVLDYGNPRVSTPRLTEAIAVERLSRSRSVMSDYSVKLVIQGIGCGHTQCWNSELGRFIELRKAIEKVKNRKAGNLITLTVHSGHNLSKCASSLVFLSVIINA